MFWELASVALQYDQATNFWVSLGISNYISPTFNYYFGRVFFILKTVLSLVLTYKGLADIVILQHKMKEKTNCHWIPIFLRLFNSTLLMVSTVGTLSYIFLSDDIMPTQLVSALLVYIFLNLFTHTMIMLLNLSPADNDENRRIAVIKRINNWWSHNVQLLHFLILQC